MREISAARRPLRKRGGSVDKRQNWAATNVSTASLEVHGASSDVLHWRHADDLYRLWSEPQHPAAFTL